MRSIYFLIISACFALNNAYAQSHEQKKYGTETYNIYRNVSFSSGLNSIDIINCRDTLSIKKLKEQDLCMCNYLDGAIFLNAMKSVFSAEKKKSLASDGKEATDRKEIAFFIYYDAASGQILYVYFALYGNITLSYEEKSSTAVTLKEIYQLETQIKAQRLKLDLCNCSKFKYGTAIYSFPLHRLYMLK